MTIDKLRRLWYLSTVPTHSPDSLKELHQLVREAAPFLIQPDMVGPCNVCANKDKCIDNGDIARAIPRTIVSIAHVIPAIIPANISISSFPKY